jgi:hypothetical protein
MAGKLGYALVSNKGDVPQVMPGAFQVSGVSSSVSPAFENRESIESVKMA